MAEVYNAMREHEPRVDWGVVVWDKRNTPKHFFILWMAVLGKLSTYDRMFFLDVDTNCRLCRDNLETHEHLFFDCSFTKAIWETIRLRFGLPSNLTSIEQTTRWLSRNAKDKSCASRARIFAFSATIYYVWHARNAKALDGNSIPSEGIIRLILAHVFRLLYSIFPWMLLKGLGYKGIGSRYFLVSCDVFLAGSAVSWIGIGMASAV